MASRTRRLAPGCASLLFGFAVALTGTACEQSDFGTPVAEEEPPGPGTQAWGDEDVSCTTNADCSTGEACENNVCQVKRCATQDFTSGAPLGRVTTFARDQELLILDEAINQGGYWVDAYVPQGDGVTYTGGGSRRLPEGGGVLDVAAGDFTAQRPDRIIVARAGDRRVSIVGGPQDVRMDVGFEPIALAAGDTDNDNLDEIIALAEDGRVAVCHVLQPSCSRIPTLPEGEDGVDIAAGDVDGDGIDEIVIMGDEGTLVVYDVDRGILSSADMDDGVMAIAVQDLDRDGVAEVLALDEGGWGDLAADDLRIYGIADGYFNRLGVIEVDSDSVDLTAGTFDVDGTVTVGILLDDGYVDFYTARSATELDYRRSTQLSATGEPARLAVGDYDGDSPRGTLVAGPELVPGEVMPTAVLYLPPYDGEHSRGVASVTMGDSAQASETFSDTVSLSMGIEVGVGFDFGIFEAKLSSKISKEISQSHSVQQYVTVGKRFSYAADPSMYGNEYAAVVLSCGCYHAYTYQLDDPLARLGDNGKQFVVVLPVGGQTQLWSSRRYNAMARALGSLPIVDVPWKVGRPETYPQAPLRADGSPVAQDDLVFRNPPVLRVSDLGDSSFYMVAGERETNDRSMKTSVSVSGSISVPGFSFGANAGTGFGQSHSVSVGKDALFAGGVPPIPDDPATPEDEYAQHVFSYSPVVYREHYTDAAGNDAAYYVVSYVVGQ